MSLAQALTQYRIVHQETTSSTIISSNNKLVSLSEIWQQFLKYAFNLILQ